MAEPDPESTPPPARRPIRWGRWVLLFCILVFGAGAWIGHSILLERLIRDGLNEGLKVMGLSNLRAEIGSMRTSLAQTILLENIRILPVEGSPSASRIHVDRVEIARTSLWRSLFGARRPMAFMNVEGLDGVLDFRQKSLPPFEPLPSLTEDQEQMISVITRHVVPQMMNFSAVNLEILADDQRYRILGASANFSEFELGTIRVAESFVEAGPVHLASGPQEAVTAWKQGKLYLSGLQVAPRLMIDNFTADLANPGGVALGFDLRIYDGTLRGDVSFREHRGLLYIDVALLGRAIQVADLAVLVGETEPAEGVVQEFKAVYRGSPDAQEDAEVSLRLEVDHLQWRKRGWERFELSAALLERRIQIPQFELRQKENSLRMHGEMALPVPFEEAANSPFNLYVSADVQDLATLGQLLGAPWEELSGRMVIRSVVSGRLSKPEGFLNVETDAVAFRGLTVESARLETVFANQEAQIKALQVQAGKDHVQAHGSISLFRPNQYSGELRLQVEDISRYLVLANLEVPVTSGAMDVHWQGDGTIAAHSGVFQVQLRDLVSEWTPEGLNGEFEGSYSPESLHFGKASLLTGKLRLNSSLTLSQEGIDVPDLHIQAGDTSLLSGAIYLPLNPLALAQGQPLGRALVADRPAEVAIQSTELELAQLFQLLGQDAAARGLVHLNMKLAGPVENLSGEGDFRLQRFQPIVEGAEIPESQVQATLALKEGVASLDGEWRTEGFEPVRLHARLPARLEVTETGELRPASGVGEVDAAAIFPRTDLQVFRPFLPDMRVLQGVLSGEVRVTGEISDPKLTGELRLEGGRVEFSRESPPISDLQLLARFDKNRVNLESFSGAAGAGPFNLQGSLELPFGEAPLAVDLRLTGKEVLLARNPGVRLRSNFDLTIAGKGESGKIAGRVGLTGGRIYRRLEITPLIVQGGVEEELPATVIPDLEGQIPEPFAKWVLDVEVANDSPFLVSGNIATGNIEPNLRLTGALQSPLPVGRVVLRDLRAFLPFTTMIIPEGIVSFDAANPGVPMLDIRGYAEAQEYRIQAYAYGPLDARNLVMRSDPPLSQESIILLLTTGFVPGNTSGAGFGEAAAGQGGLLLLRAFVRQFEGQGVDLDSIVNRLQVAAVPPQDYASRATLRGTFRMTDAFSLMAERDDLGFVNAGVSYTLRFR